MRRILGCILSVLGLAAVLTGVAYLVAADGATSCTGGTGDPVGCSAGAATLQWYFQTVGLVWVLAGALLGLVPGILLMAWPRRRAPRARPAAAVA